MLSACAGVQPVAYSSLASSSQLKENRDHDAAQTPFRYTAPVVWSRYSQVIVDPVAVYRGNDNQFGDLSDEDKDALAAYMKKSFSETLSKHFDLATQPSPATLRLKLTLTGAEKTTAVIGQAMHFDIAGNLYNGVQAVRGGKGAFSGSVSYAVEVYDSSTGRLLRAYVTKQYPNAMNLPAAFGSLSAARTGIDKGATALVEQLR
ncbi:putative lipoprotein [Burkholderia sp. H160]|nr:putative lipoprotein [Burkholderia sp. H160]